MLHNKKNTSLLTCNRRLDFKIFPSSYLILIQRQFNNVTLKKKTLVLIQIAASGTSFWDKEAMLVDKAMTKFGIARYGLNCFD